VTALNRPLRQVDRDVVGRGALLTRREPHHGLAPLLVAQHARVGELLLEHLHLQLMLVLPPPFFRFVGPLLLQPLVAAQPALYRAGRAGHEIQSDAHVRLPRYL